MELSFRAVAEARAGAKWQALYHRFWPSYKAWFLAEGDAARPSYPVCIRKLREHMPELVPTYEMLVDLAGGGDLAARFLSGYRPPAYVSGCTQAVWTSDKPLLVRNYDYSPDLLEGTIVRTEWNDHPVIAMGDGLWGAVDGMNASGLAVSLAFGGRQTVGDGFGITLILRYILEFCRTTGEAVKALKRVPTHMSYNVTMLDREQRFATVFVAPDRTPIVRQLPIATNHQGKIEWRRHAWATATLEREHAVASRLADCDETGEGFVAAFLEPPLFNTAYQRGFGTLYTAVYRPLDGVAEYRWRTASSRQSFGRFTEGEWSVNLRGLHRRPRASDGRK